MKLRMGQDIEGLERQKGWKEYGEQKCNEQQQFREGWIVQVIVSNVSLIQ